MDLFIPHDCDICGFSGEAKLQFSGPHIKQLCGNPKCNTYVKFISKSLVPDSKEIRMQIWKITQDLSVLNRIKQSIGFVDGLTGLDLKIMYWRLYLKVREEFGQNFCEG